LAPQVDLFPLPGFTPGNCGLLLAHPTRTTVIAGDAVATTEHLERGQVLRGSFDIEQARESLLEVIEIADAVVPGHDNVVLNPTRRG
jgi:glyoxylase-like metal-dependent hydrolase (beta-lactamase superfamily II)